MAKASTIAERYDKRMTLYKESLAAASASGEQASVGSILGRIWCSLKPVSGREYIAAAQAQSEVTHVIRTWYRSDIVIDSTCWLMLGTRRFNIKSAVDVNEEHRTFEIMAIEQT